MRGTSRTSSIGRCKHHFILHPTNISIRLDVTLDANLGGAKVCARCNVPDITIVMEDHHLKEIPLLAASMTILIQLERFCGFRPTMPISESLASPLLEDEKEGPECERKVVVKSADGATQSGLRYSSSTIPATGFAARAASSCSTSTTQRPCRELSTLPSHRRNSKSRTMEEKTKKRTKTKTAARALTLAAPPRSTLQTGTVVAPVSARTWLPKRAASTCSTCSTYVAEIEVYLCTRRNWFNPPLPPTAEAAAVAAAASGMQQRPALPVALALRLFGAVTPTKPFCSWSNASSNGSNGYRQQLQIQHQQQPQRQQQQQQQPQQ